MLDKLLQSSVVKPAERNGNTLPTSMAFRRKSRLFRVVIRSRANVCLFWARCVATARSGSFWCSRSVTLGSVADLLNAGRVLAGLVRRFATRPDDEGHPLRRVRVQQLPYPPLSS